MYATLASHPGFPHALLFPPHTQCFQDKQIKQLLKINDFLVISTKDMFGHQAMLRTDIIGGQIHTKLVNQDMYKMVCLTVLCNLHLTVMVMILSHSLGSLRCQLMVQSLGLVIRSHLLSLLCLTQRSPHHTFSSSPTSYDITLFLTSPECLLYNLTT